MKMLWAHGTLIFPGIPDMKFVRISKEMTSANNCHISFKHETMRKTIKSLEFYNLAKYYCAGSNLSLSYRKVTFSS